MRGERRSRGTASAFSQNAATSVLISLLLFADILLFGANRTDLALVFSAFWLLTAAGLLVTQRWARVALDEARLGWIGLSFFGVLAYGVLSLTPLAIGGPNPIWSWVPGSLPCATIDPYGTIVELIKLAGLAATFGVGLLVGSDDDRAKSLVRWLLGFGIAYSLWAFYNRVADPAWLFGAPRAFDPNRLSASLVSANTASVFFGALSLLNLIDLDRRLRRNRLDRNMSSRELERLISDVALPIIGLASAMTCLILTLSRTGISATVAITAILIGGGVAARARQGAVSAPVLGTTTLLLGLVVVSFALNIDPLQDRLKFLSDDAVTRRTIFAAHWAAFNAAPLSGYGLGSFSRINAMIMNQGNFAALEDIGATHNVYLQWLEQAGAIGAAAMFSCMGLITLRITQGAVRRRRMRPWLIGILAVLALFLVQGVSDFALEVPAMAAWLSFLLGLGCGIAGISSRPGVTRRPRC